MSQRSWVNNHIKRGHHASCDTGGVTASRKVHVRNTLHIMPTVCHSCVVLVTEWYTVCFYFSKASLSVISLFLNEMAVYRRPLFQTKSSERIFSGPSFPKTILWHKPLNDLIFTLSAHMMCSPASSRSRGSINCHQRLVGYFEAQTARHQEQ